jgi:hypothetical protein
MKKRMLAHTAFALFAFILADGTSYAQPNYSQLQHLTDANRMAEAYDLASRLAPQSAGTPNFDFLYGLAALKSHHPGEAAFAFRRVLMVNPGNQAARLLLAESNLELKDHISAKRNLAELIKQNPNAKIRLQAEEDLQKINEIERRLRTTKIGYFRVEGGYDSNANAAPLADQINLPLGGPLRLIPSSRETPSWYDNLSAGVSVNHKIDNKRSFYAEISGFKRINYASRARKFDYAILRADTGLIYRQGLWRIKLPVNAEQLYSGDSLFRDAFANAVEIGRPVGNNYFSALFQNIFYLYPRLRTRDGHLFAGSLDWVYKPPTIPAEFNTRFVAGDGNARDPLSGFLINSYLGGQFRVKWRGILRKTPYFSLSYQHSFYNGINRLFIRARGDDFFNAVVGVECQLNRNWWLTPSYSYAYNSSNIRLYQYHRNQIQVGLEYRIL